MAKTAVMGVVVSLAWAGAVAAAETGSVCVAPVQREARMGVVHDTVIRPDGSTLRRYALPEVKGPFDFSVSFDGRPPMAVSQDTPLAVAGLSLTERHSVRIWQSGVPSTSFHFRFSQYEGRPQRLCLWFKPMYESWSLTAPVGTPGCRCGD